MNMLNNNIFQSINSGTFKLFDIPEMNPKVAFAQSTYGVQQQQYEDLALFQSKIEPMEDSETVQWNVGTDVQLKIEDDAEENSETNECFKYSKKVMQATKKIQKNSISVGIQKKKVIKGYQDTKNIPKNFGKAIMKYIKEHEAEARKLLGNKHDFETFFKRISAKKDKIISIKVFKTLFDDNSKSIDLNKETIDKNIDNLRAYNKVYRILAYKFLRSEFQAYLQSNKKIKHSSIMNKYKIVLQNGLKNPEQFISWKINNFE